MSEISIPRLLKKREVATALSCSVKHVEHLIKAGKLEAVKLGPNTLRVPLQSLTAFITGSK